MTSNGFITAAEAGSNFPADFAIHAEISQIEAEILTQSNLGFNMVNVTNTLMTSAILNSPMTLSGVISTGVTSGSTIPFADTVGYVAGSVVTDLTNPTGIFTGSTVSSLSGNSAVLSHSIVYPPGVLDQDQINFAKTLTTNAPTASGSTLHFASTTGVAVGMGVNDTTTSGVIPGGTVVTAVGGSTITINNSVLLGGVLSSDTITFSYTKTVENPQSTQITLSSGTNSYASGAGVMFTSTGTLPNPLVAGTVYFLAQLDLNGDYAVCATRQDALQSNPIAITLLDVGSGTISVTLIGVAVLYFNAWQNYYANPEARIYTAQMTQVINYFTSLGYNINRIQQSNVTANPLLTTFYWNITW